MRANFGEHFKLTIFGESHGAAIGIVIDGLPAGAAMDEESIARQMARRAPGNDPTATARKEADAVRILSGVRNGRATGAPLCAMIENTNTRSGRLPEHRGEHAPRSCGLRRVCEIRWHTTTQGAAGIFPDG